MYRWCGGQLPVIREIFNIIAYGGSYRVPCTYIDENNEKLVCDSVKLMLFI